MSNTEHIATSEPITERRTAALKAVDVQKDVMRQFAEQYRFKLNGSQDASVDAALEYLNKTFFRGLIDNGRRITSYHQMQVITVALETGLNPFNNELYGVFTPFGDLKVMATVDGWMRLATSQDIDNREFTYSDSTESVEINGHQYHVPTWVECKLHSKEKGTSQAREYFWEVYNNSMNQTLTWSRPSRTLTNVSFIQALRRMLRVTALADSDIIADINRHYEAEMAKQTTSKIGKGSVSKPPVKQSRELNIDIDTVEIIDLSVKDEAVLDQEPESVEQPPEKCEKPETVSKEKNEVESDEAPNTLVSEEVVSAETETTTSKPIISSVERETVITEPVSETSVPREVLMIIKPLIQQVKFGQKSVEDLIKVRRAITSEIGLKWFDDEVEQLK